METTSNLDDGSESISDNDDESVTSEISPNLTHFDPAFGVDSDEEDHRYDSNRENISMNIDDTGRSFVSNVSHEINNENDSMDNDDQWSIITHITDYMSSGGEEVSSDDGYGTKIETDSLFDDDGNNLATEIQNEAFLDGRITTMEPSLIITLSAGIIQKLFDKLKKVFHSNRFII